MTIPRRIEKQPDPCFPNPEAGVFFCAKEASMAASDKSATIYTDAGPRRAARGRRAALAVARGFSVLYGGDSPTLARAREALGGIEADRLLAAAAEHPITVNFDMATVTSPLQDRFPFAMRSLRRHRLMAGLDEIAMTSARAPAIAASELRTGT